MKRIALPMVGGVITSTMMELLVYPAIYYIWRGAPLRSGGAAADDPSERLSG